MKFPALDFLPSLLVAFGLFGAVAVFVSEARSFREAVVSWAKRDLDARTELAASTLKEAVETGDFRRIHEFGGECSDEGVRLTVFSAPGGIVFDSAERAGRAEECLFAVRPCGEFRVRLGLPLSRVMAPYRRARTGFLLAGIVGGAGVLFVLLFNFRQRAKVRELARERDAQRRLLEEMRKVEEFRRDFIADVSHEIKTPLTGIIGSVDLLASSEDLSPDDRCRLMSMIKSESGRINDLAQGILSLAKLERDMAAGVSDFAMADIAELVRDVAGRLDAQAREKGMAIRVEAPESCETMCDGQLIAGAVSNLVVNAIRHSGSKEILVSVADSSGSVSISVEDRGTGIPEEHRDRVFDRFYRVDRSRSPGDGGAGLGLAIVRSVARLHGGDAELTPVDPSGCRFSLKFPRSFGELRVAAKPENGTDCVPETDNVE